MLFITSNHILTAIAGQLLTVYKAQMKRTMNATVQAHNPSSSLSYLFNTSTDLMSIDLYTFYNSILFIQLQAAYHLHEDFAAYPKKINYVVSPPHLAVESLEVCWTFTSCVYFYIHNVVKFFFFYSQIITAFCLTLSK